MSVHALILAGGQGRRLGDVRKADLRIGGRRLLDRVTDRLRDVSQPLLVSTGPSLRIAGEAFNIPDGSEQHDGPAAGILAGARHLRGRAAPDDILVTVAVDTPFLPPDYVARLVAVLEQGASAAYAAFGSQIYPPNAAWRLGALLPLLDGPRPASPKAMLRALDAVAVDWSGHDDADPFANLNTLADLVALGRRAQAAGE